MLVILRHFDQDAPQREIMRPCSPADGERLLLRRAAYHINRTGLVYNAEGRLRQQDPLVQKSLIPTFQSTFPNNHLCACFHQISNVLDHVDGLWKDAVPSVTGTTKGSMTDSCIAYIRKFTIRVTMPYFTTISHHRYSYDIN